MSQERENFSEIKDGPIFTDLCGVVKEALRSWYPEILLTALNPENIHFLSDSDFEQKPGNPPSLFRQALALSGVDLGKYFPAEDSSSQFSSAQIFEGPPQIYFRESVFRAGLSSKDPKDSGETLNLGYHLLYFALSLCPQRQEDSQLSGLVKDRLERFFGFLSPEPPVKPEKLEKANDMMVSLIEGGLAKPVSFGAHVFLLLPEEEREVLQFRFGQDLNEGIIYFFLHQVEGKFLDSLGPKFSRVVLKAIRESRRELRQKEQGLIDGALEFLQKLGLRDYLSIFAAYQQSQIPQIYWEKRQQGKIKPDLVYPS